MFVFLVLKHSLVICGKRFSRNQSHLGFTMFYQLTPSL